MLAAALLIADMGFSAGAAAGAGSGTGAGTGAGAVGDARGSAAPAPPPPRRVVGGELVQPDAACLWSDLLEIDIVAGRLRVRTKAPPEIAGFLANGRTVTVQIGDLPQAVWLVQARSSPAAPPPGGGAIAPPLNLSLTPKHRPRNPRDLPGNLPDDPRGNPRDNPPDGHAPLVPREPVDLATLLESGVAPIRVIASGARFALSLRHHAADRATSIAFQSNGDTGEVRLIAHQTVRGRLVAAPPMAVSLKAASLIELCEDHPAEVRRILRPLLAAIADGHDPLCPRGGDIYRAFEQIPADPQVSAQLPAIVKAFDALDPAVRESASAELEALGRAGVLAAVRFDRTDLSPEQRSRLDNFVAGHTLRRSDGRLRDADDLRRNKNFLVDCLADDEPAVRAAALAALRERTGRRIEFDLDAPPAQRRAAVAELARSITVSAGE